MQELFNIMRKYWKPKPRSKSQQKLLGPNGDGSHESPKPIEPSPPEPPAAQGTPTGEKTPPDSQDQGSGDEEAVSPRNLSEDFEQAVADGLDSQNIFDGESTPDTHPAIDDEYLAWTLGGQLMKTPSPQSLMLSNNDLTPLSKELLEIEHLDSRVWFHQFHCFSGHPFPCGEFFRVTAIHAAKAKNVRTSCEGFGGKTTSNLGYCTQSPGSLPLENQCLKLDMK